MSEKVSLEDLMAMFAEIFEVEEEDISPQSEKDDIEGWDSMGVLSLMAEYDSLFDIALTPVQLESFKTVNDLIDVVRSAGLLVE